MEKPRLLKDLGRFIKTNTNQVCHYGLYKCPYCKKEFTANMASVNYGGTQSCGCLAISVRGKNNYKHGLRQHPTHEIWASMKKRCNNPNDQAYKYYGARGVTVCKEWNDSFKSFFDWIMQNGWEKGLTIDRIKNNEGYSPDNCRFVSRCRNMQNTRLLYSHNKSGYRGVFHHNSGGWVAAICYNNIRYYLGYYKTPEQAAQAYNDFVIEHHTFHPLNIIPHP